jgi:molecular chaperone DnaK (HSP70)
MDFDRALYDHFAAEIKEKYKVDCVGKVRPTLRLFNESEKMKKLMSANTQKLPMNIECFMDDKDVQLKIERAQLDEMTTGLVNKAKDCVDRLLAKLKDLKIKLSDLYSVEVVGGASRIKSIQALLENSFEKPLSTTLNTDEAVARGCALQAAISSPTFRVRDFTVVDKTPYGILLCWEGSGEEESANSLEVFSPGSESRISKILSFYRDADFDLTAKYIEPSPGPAHIGTFKVIGAKPSYDGKTQKIKVKLKLDENGIFVVESASMVDKLQPTEEASEETKVPTLAFDPLMIS